VLSLTELILEAMLDDRRGRRIRPLAREFVPLK
jgi:hypothetical protein